MHLVRLPKLAILGRSVVLTALVGASFCAFAAPERGAPLPRKGVLGAQLKADAAGVAVAATVPNLTAEGLGLKPGDIVKQINGTATTSPADVGRILSKLTAGTTITIDVVRDGKPMTLKGTLSERPRQHGDGFEVVYDQVVSQGKRIRVIETHPKGKGPFPTIFLIGGIGGYSVDGEFTTTPYGTILEPLAKTDYATIRIDKPGQGDSEGPAYADLRFDDEFDAYLQALRLSKTLPFVDPKRVAIFGHSMGGAFAPLLASDEKVAAIAVSGTVAKTWFEYQLENTRRQSLLAGASAEWVDEELRQLSAVGHYVFNEAMSIDEVAKKHPEVAEMAKGLSPDGRTISGVGVPFFQQLAKKNLVAAWQKIEAKVLTQWGENDFVSTRWDHEFIAEIVNARTPGAAKFQLVPNSDHGFNETTSMKDSLARWGRPGSKFNPNVVDYLRDWLKSAL